MADARVSVDWLLHGTPPERIAWAADDRARLVDPLVSLRSGDAGNG